MILVEAMIALSILTVLGLTLLKLSLNVLAPRQWVMQQTVSDAYLTYERAYAERIPFGELVAVDPPTDGRPYWPAAPDTAVVTEVEIGRMPKTRDFPNGLPIIGTVTRIRFPDANNYPIDGGSGTVDTNPSAMKIWKAQSVLTYKVGTRTYAKSRTVLRSQ